MRPQTLTRQLDTADPNGIAQSQTPLTAGNLTLNGDLVTAGVGILDQQRKILITPAGADAGRTFTITGTVGGVTITEEVSGANNPATSTSLLDFDTVTQIAVDAATAGAIIVGTSGIGASEAIKWDRFITPFQLTISLDVTGTVDVTVEYTTDDLGADAPGPYNWKAHAFLTNITADDDGTIISPVSAIRLLTNSGTGTCRLRAIQSGPR